MLFFKELVKSTLQLKYVALRYQLLFWNSVQAVLALSETHSLDYVADFWVVSEISSIHKHMVYDSVTFFEYCDPLALFLRIKEMTIEFDLFPSMTRSFTIVKEEFVRVKFALKFNKESNVIKEKNLFFCFGQTFVSLDRLNIRANKRVKRKKKWWRWYQRRSKKSGNSRNKNFY